MSRINYFFEKIVPFNYGLPPKKWIRLCLCKEDWGIGNLNFIFCSDRYLQKMNKKYLNKSELTDVISFKTHTQHLSKQKKSSMVFGDVFISIDRVKENQKIYKTIFTRELRRVMIHGTLHLIGFNDSSPEEQNIMTQKENTYIKL